MGDSYRAEQEGFWAGEFGDAYVNRNSDPNSIAYRAFSTTGITTFRLMTVLGSCYKKSSDGINLSGLSHFALHMSGWITYIRTAAFASKSR